MMSPSTEMVLSSITLTSDLRRTQDGIVLEQVRGWLGATGWLTQTTWSGQSGPRVFQHRTKLRPMRPKPLIATLILSSATTVFLTAACKRKERRAQIAGQSSKSGKRVIREEKYIMYTRSVFRPSSTPFLPLFLPLSGDHTIHSFEGDRLPFKISGNTHRALDTTTSTHEEVTTRWRPLSWGRLFCLFSSYKWRLVFVRARRRRRLATSADRWSDRFGSRVISLFFSLPYSVSRYHLLSWPFRENAHKTIEKREREKAYLSDGAVLELAGDSRELRELGGLRREMRVRLRVERSDRRLSRTNAVRGTFCEKRLLHTFSSSNNTQMRIEHPKKKKKKETPRVKLPEDHARCPRANVGTRRVDRIARRECLSVPWR